MSALPSAEHSLEPQFLLPPTLFTCSSKAFAAPVLAEVSLFEDVLEKKAKLVICIVLCQTPLKACCHVQRPDF